MTASCQPLPRNVAEEILQVVARALCDRAGDSPAQREGRTRQMVVSTLGLAPRDGLEFMLATLAFGHFQIILDAMRDVFRGQTDALKAKTRTSIVPLGRSMLKMLRELRLVQLRPALQEAEDAGKQAAVEAQPQQAAAAPPDALEVPPAEPDALTEEELATLSDPRLGLPAEVIAWLAGTAPAVQESVARDAAVLNPGEPPRVPMNLGDRTAAAGLPCNVFALAHPPATGSDTADLAACENPGKPGEGHSVSTRETLAAMSETLAQGRVETARAKAASGD